MYNFVLHISFMLGLAVMIYLMARAVPRISDEAMETAFKQNPLERWWRSIPLERLDAMGGVLLEKTLRKLKLGIMKLDNAVGSGLEKAKKFSGNGSRNGNAERQTKLFEKDEKSDGGETQ